MTALTLHEAVPGHHLQIALAIGAARTSRSSAGTATTPRSSRAGRSTRRASAKSMGVYDDPYSKLGQLTYEMWRAVRLVVDTGIHHLHWDRQRAIDFFLENAAKSELDVVNEVDRYIVVARSGARVQDRRARDQEAPASKRAARLGDPVRSSRRSTRRCSAQGRSRSTSSRAEIEQAKRP